MRAYCLTCADHDWLSITHSSISVDAVQSREAGRVRVLQLPDSSHHLTVACLPSSAGFPLRSPHRPGFQRSESRDCKPKALTTAAQWKISTPCPLPKMSLRYPFLRERRQGRKKGTDTNLVTKSKRRSNKEVSIALLFNGLSEE